VNQELSKFHHDRFAPYWAAMLVFLGLTGISTTWFDFGPFWKGYVLDITGPAWNYILFRGLYTAKTVNVWTRFFTPNRTLIIFLVVCFGIETIQYYNIYDATYDTWDFLAYCSILIPIYIIDLILFRFNKQYSAQ
jgi:hypothetical protein